MKQIYNFIATFTFIVASAFYANAQTDYEILKALSDGIETGLNEEKAKPEFRDIITYVNSEYNGRNIVVSITYTYNLHNSTQETIDNIINSLSEEYLKSSVSYSLSTTWDSDPEVKDYIIDVFKRNNCHLIYNYTYNLPNKTKHLNITLSADDISGKNDTNKDYITYLLNKFNQSIKSEIGSNGIVNAYVEFDGSNMVMTYELNFDKELIENLPTTDIKNEYVSSIKSNNSALTEVKQLKTQNIDIIILYSGTNGGTKSVFIDTAQF